MIIEDPRAGLLKCNPFLLFIEYDLPLCFFTIKSNRLTPLPARGCLFYCPKKVAQSCTKLHKVALRFHPNFTQRKKKNPSNIMLTGICFIGGEELFFPLCIFQLKCFPRIFYVSRTPVRSLSAVCGQIFTQIFTRFDAPESQVNDLCGLFDIRVNNMSVCVEGLEVNGMSDTVFY